MRVLVTGGAGYIGSITVERLLGGGHEVVVIDNLWRGHRSAVPPEAVLIESDLRDLDRVRTIVRTTQPDTIMHFAGATLVHESMTRPADYFGINVVGSHHLLEAMRAAEVPAIVFSSTAAVYGVPARVPVAETDPVCPISVYGQSKLMVEEMLAAYAAAYGLRYAALRYFNVAGATAERGEEHVPETHVVPVALRTLQRGEGRFPIYGSDYPTPDGTAVRDYVHVVDLADAHVAAIERLGHGSLGAVNLGTKDGFSVLQLVAAVERVTGRALPVSYEPRRPGDPPILVAETSKARRVLGWSPRQSTLDEMIGSAWEWLQRHPDGYRDRPMPTSQGRR